MYNEEQVREATLAYFDGDELATNVFMTKYCLRDNKGNYVEKTPDDMHRRIASEFARMEDKFGGNNLTETEIYSYLKDFKYIVPQGSPMMGIGNDYVNVSLSNCVVVDNPQKRHDSKRATCNRIADKHKAKIKLQIAQTTLQQLLNSHHRDEESCTTTDHAEKILK